MRFTARLSAAQPWTVTRRQLRRGPGRAGQRAAARRRLDVGRDRRAARQVHVDDRDTGRPLGDGIARRRRGARAAEGARPPPARSRPAETTTILVHADRGGDRHGDARRPRRRRRSRRCSPRRSRRARRRSRSRRRRACRTASTRSRSPRPRARQTVDGERTVRRSTTSSPRSPRRRTSATLHAHARAARRRASRSCAARASSRRRRRCRTLRAADVHVGRRLADGPAPDGRTSSLTVTDEVGDVHAHGDARRSTRRRRRSRFSRTRICRFRVSGGRDAHAHRREPHATRASLKKPATTQFWLKTKPRAYALTATDAAGNVTTVRYRR